MGQTLGLFLAFVVIAGAFLGAGAYVIHQNAMSLFISRLKLHETSTVNLQESAIRYELENVVSEVCFLTRQNELVDYLRTGNPALKPRIESEYLNLAEAMEFFDQIRLLDASGMEIIRVNHLDEYAQVTAIERLQNKSARYYFRDTYALPEDKIFVSPMDLNVEHGKIEMPIKPMLRIGTPLFTQEGEKKGILLINYAASRLLDRVRNAGNEGYGTKMMLNSLGYWLLGPDSDRNWGFMFEDKAEETFDSDYPQEWTRMLQTGKGQFMNDNGLFTYSVLYPLEEGQYSSSGSSEANTPSAMVVDPARYFWVLVTHVRPSVLQTHSSKLTKRILFWTGLLFVLIAFSAWQLAQAIVRRRAYQQQLITMAHYDALTGLPNRKYFFDRLEKDLAAAKRHDRKLALLYIDLDGFKNVNDTLGHEAGDELLVKVAGALKGRTRADDTVARLGGDEFAVILSEVSGEEAAGMVGNQLVEALCCPIELEKKTVQIGASIGVAIYPDHAQEANELVRLSDESMYQSKAMGKNTCSIMKGTCAAPETD